MGQLAYNNGNFKVCRPTMYVSVCVFLLLLARRMSPNREVHPFAIRRVEDGIGLVGGCDEQRMWRLMGELIRFVVAI